MSILAWIVWVWSQGGWRVSSCAGGYGLVGDIVLGVVGAIVGGFLSGLILGRDMVSGFNLERVSWWPSSARLC